MHIRFPSLELFSSVYERAVYKSLTIVHYGGKPKVHGISGAFQITPQGDVVFQSKRKILDIDNDQDNMVKFNQQYSSVWSKAAQDNDIVFYGEWAGPRINKGDAVQRTDKPRFYIFAVGLGVVHHPHDEDKFISEWMITDPEAIATYLPKGIDPDLVRVLPWETHYSFNFTSEETLAPELARLNADVSIFDIVDPYFKREFGIEHPGEGLVCVRKSSNIGELSGEDYARSTFKAKTAKHRVRKQGKPALPKDPLPPTVPAFVEAYVTDARLNQAIDEICETMPHISQTGKIVAWMLTDIQKEGQKELDDMNLSFLKVKPSLGKAIQTLWMPRVKRNGP
jgi:hypothetical protein